MSIPCTAIIALLHRRAGLSFDEDSELLVGEVEFLHEDGKYGRQEAIEAAQAMHEAGREALGNGADPNAVNHLVHYDIDYNEWGQADVTVLVGHGLPRIV